MSNPTFSTATPDTLAPDPSKRVNYTQGMVLGVDDFQQEFAYLSNRDQWLARDAIGYGTVCGLHVSLDPADHNSISVSPGVAINPRGQLIRVTPRQCAKIDAWLALQTTIDRMSQLGLSASGDLTAYVVLCYRDCPTDEVPVPGEPCRCDSDTMAASRIIDDFRLELTLEPPPQLEEDAIRDFVSWLRGIEIADFDPAPGDLEAFLQAIKDALRGITSPPASSPDLPDSPPDFFYGSPPAGLRIPRRLLCEWMRATLRLWVTDLRPLWQAQCAPQKACACGGPCGCHGSGAQPDDMACDCLLLAAVRIKRGSGGITSAELDEERRPYVVHLRMLQELLLCGPSCCDSCGDSRTFATVIALDENTLQIWIHHPVQLDLPDDAVTLELGGVPVTGFTISPSVSPPHLNVFDLTFSGSPGDVMGNSTMIGLEFDANLILEPDGRSLATAIWQDRYCYGDYVEPLLRVFGASGTLVLGGDVTGPPADNKLDAIHGKPLDLTTLASQTVLGFDGTKWKPMALQSTSAPPAENTIPFGAFAKGPDIGASLRYAREDHTHGLPADPIKPHVGNLIAHSLHQIGGDVKGVLGNTVVERLQGVPLSDTSLGTGEDGFVLTYRTAPKRWVAEQNAFRVTSGLVVFQQVEAGQARTSEPILHGFDNQLVMIRLGWGMGEQSEWDVVEDVNSYLPISMVVAYGSGTPTFLVWIRAPKDKDKWDWVIRWWAVPVTESRKTVYVPPEQQNDVPRELIISVASLGITVPVIAAKLGVAEAKVQSVVEKLKKEGAVRVVKGRILPPA